MDQTYYAHSLEGKPPSDWQPLEDHLKKVAELARSFAADFLNTEAFMSEDKLNIRADAYLSIETLRASFYFLSRTVAASMGENIMTWEK